MATGEQKENPDRHYSEASGSEAVFDHTCTPCSEEAVKEAVGFCVDCYEWLCDECFRYHTRPKPARFHVLMTSEEVKQSTSPLKKADKCSEKCKTHDGKRFKFFCPAHDFFGCSMCVIESHRTCAVKHIPDIAAAVETKTEFQEVTAKYEAVAKDSIEMGAEINDDVRMIKTKKEETVNNFHEYRKQIDKTLDEIEAVLEERCRSKEEEETQKLKIIEEKCDANEKECLSLKTKLEELEQTGQPCNLFVALKRSKHESKTLAENVKGIKGTPTVTVFTFNPNLNVAETLNSSEGIG